MRLKSSYRPKPYRDGGAVTAETPPAGMETAASIDGNHNHSPDEASEAFKRQIDALHQSEAAAADEVGRDKSHGLAVHSLPFFDLVKANFEDRLRNSPPEEPVKPKRARGGAVDDDDRDEPQRTRFMSAPVSRGDDGGGSFGHGHGSDKPGRITLSIEQKDMARRLGMSVKDYAEGLLEMRQTDKEYGR